MVHTFILSLNPGIASPRSQADGDFIHLNYGKFAIQNFTTYYSNTKITFSVKVLPFGSKVNFSVFDHGNYTNFLKNITIIPLFEVINAQNNENYTIIIRKTGNYYIWIENNDPAQKRIGTAVFRRYIDDPYFNPGTIPIYILFIIIILIISLIGVVLFLKFR